MGPHALLGRRERGRWLLRWGAELCKLPRKSGTSLAVRALLRYRRRPIGDRLMVGQQPLELLIKVRILVPEPARLVARKHDMKLDKSTFLFFATKVDSKLREGLNQSKPGDKKYFDGSSEEFLRVMEIGDE